MTHMWIFVGLTNLMIDLEKVMYKICASDVHVTCLKELLVSVQNSIIAIYYLAFQNTY
jgi:hypothetical protein